jgi:transposase
MPLTGLSRGYRGIACSPGPLPRRSTSAAAARHGEHEGTRLTGPLPPGRVRSEAAFAALAGVSPIPESSGNTGRHRLNRHGDRQLNQALDTIARQLYRRIRALMP